MLRHLLHITLRGAVAGGKAALLPALPIEWLEPLVKLDAAVKSPGWGVKPAWWRRWLHGAESPHIFDVAFFELLSRQKYKRDVGGLKPAYAYAGTGKGAGLRCIDSELSEPADSYTLPRMIRTADGREVLQQQLIKEREAQANEAASTA